VSEPLTDEEIRAILSETKAEREKASKLWADYRKAPKGSGVRIAVVERMAKIPLLNAKHHLTRRRAKLRRAAREVLSRRLAVRKLLEDPMADKGEIARVALRLGWWERELAGLMESRRGGKRGGRPSKKKA
jgi:hypothetical protein